MEKNNNNKTGKNGNDVFSAPEVETDRGFTDTLKRWIKKNLKIIIPTGLIILLIFLIIFLLGGNKSKLFPPVINSNYVKNYHTGIESNIEFILLNLHNDIPVPDSVKFDADSIKFIRKDITEILSRDKLHKRLIEMGFVYSIVIDLKSYKDLEIESWIYRANYNDNEKNLVYAEFIIDFINKNNVVKIKSLELNYEHFKNLEFPDIIGNKDTSKKPVKKDSLVIADSTSKIKKDTSSTLKSKEDILNDKDRKTDSTNKEKTNINDNIIEKQQDIKSDEKDKDKPASRDTSKK